MISSTSLQNMLQNNENNDEYLKKILKSFNQNEKQFSHRGQHQGRCKDKGGLSTLKKKNTDITTSKHRKIFGLKKQYSFRGGGESC